MTTTISKAPETPAARRTCYRVKGCSHPECRAESNLYQKRLKSDQIRGVSRKVPAEKAVHLVEKRQRELGGKQSMNALAMSLGVPHRVVRLLMTGQTKYIEIATWRKMIASSVEPPKFVPNRATALRVQALAAEGWRNADLIEALQCSTALYQRGEKILYENAVKVIELVRTAGEGQSAQARAIARNKGWRPRAAYDRDLLLDPFWDGIGGLLDEEGERPEAEVREEYFRLVFWRAHPIEAAERLGKDASWARKAYREAGKPLPPGLVYTREKTA